MLSTAIGVQFNVNDLDANYEVVGTSDNYSFQYNLGRGSDIASFEGEAIQKVISLEGNYGEFDVRVFASSDIGVRSEFIESGISISPPRFDDTFTFANLRVENLPEDPNVGAVNLYEPQTPGDKLEVESEYVNRNVQITWGLIPPVGHAKEGQVLTTELLRDPFFERFQIILENGTGAQVLDNQTLANSAGMQDTLLTADVTGLLNQYREFSLTLNEAAFQDLDLDRTVGVKIISHDSFGRTATGILTGINYEPQVEGLSYALRGSDMSFSWFSNDTDFSGVHIQSLAIPSDRQLIYPADIQSSVEYYQDLNAAESWNLGRSEYRSGDMATYQSLVYRAKTEINQSLIDSTGRQNTNPLNTDLWENVGEKFDYQFNEIDVFEESYATYQVWGYSYYYSFQAIDGYGASDVYNLTDFGLAANQNLKAFTSEVKIGALRYREQEDDLIFNWDVVDQDGTLVDLDKYRFALTNSDIPSILGLSGSLFDSDTKEFLTGITEGDTAKISTVDEFGNRQVVYDLPNTEVFNTYEFTREINNQVYGTGGFLTNYEIFNSSTGYLVGDNVADSNKNIFTALADTNYQPGEPSVRPFYETWQSSETYLQNDIVEYIGDLYKLQQDFGPDSDNILGVFDTGINYTSGDLVIYPNADINPYFQDQDYLAGDIVLFDQTFYLALQNQTSGDNYFPNQYKRYWQNISVFDSLDPVIYKASGDIAASIDNPYSSADHWIPQRPNNSEYFSRYISGFNLSYSPWSDSYSYNSGSLVLYANDIWSGIKNNGPLYNAAQAPNSSPEYWTNLDSQNQNIVSDYNQGDLVYYRGAVYQCLSNTPNAAPIPAVLNFGDGILSNYLACDWIPFWEKNTTYDGFVYDHVGIPESGKRSVGLEVGIIDNNGQVLNSQRIIGINQEPSILSNGFQVDSLSETTKVKFKFNYAFSTQEKTSKVHLYRSENPNFEITGSNGLPFNSLTEPGSTLVKVTLGAADATFGDNITEIFDTPPIPKLDGIDQITGYYYKILPFDDFGSGDLYGVNDNADDLERCLVYPRNYSNKNPNGVPGPVFRTAADDIPGPVVDLSGDTAFENYFLSWIHPSGNIENRDQIPNDLSHYEVWVGNSDTDNKLQLGSLNVFLKDEADPLEDVDFSNNSGYRRIETDIPSTGPIPIEKQDPASGITNAKRIFNVPANGAEIETSYLGKTNETKYFWVRPVDFAGNKGPFTGAANLTGPEIEGLELTLGQASATDIDDFELNMTEIFGNTIALAPQPDPFDGDGSYISWPEHVLYYQGTGYLINGSGVGPNYDTQKASYIWWDNDNQADSADPDEEYVNVGLRNIYYKNINYKVSSSHPAGSRDQDSNSQDYISPDPDFGEGDFIVARLAGFPSNAAATPVYHAFANALIGTANIAEAAIVDAKINSLKADKITAGEIKGHEIVVGSRANQYGSIVTPGFTGYTNPVDGVSYPPTDNGFVLSGDGTFEFRGDQGKLTLDNDGTLSLEGRLRQSNGKDYDFVDFSSIPAYVNYVETNNGYEIENNNDLVIIARFRNTSISSADDVRFRMQVFSDGVIRDVFSYDDFAASMSAGIYDISGFSYNQFQADNATITAYASLKAGFESNVFGFHDIITSNGTTGDAVILYVSGVNSTNETSTTIGRIIDGKAGPGGPATHFRGEWSPGEYYSGSAIRGDIVYYAPDNEFYIGREPSSPSSSSFSADLNAGKWEAFGGQFTSVATNLLLAEEAVITEKLELGTLAGSTQPFSITSTGNGIITSPGFVGGIFDVNNNTVLSSNNYTTAGFSMGSYYDSSKSKNISFFDMGGQSVGNFDSYFRLNTDDGKIEMHSAFISGGINVTSDLGTVFDFNNYQNQDPRAVFIGGGYNNTITIPSFQNNFQSLASSIVAGGENNVEGRFSIIGGGYNNECKDNFSVIAGGWGNSMPQAGSENEGANFIGGGQSNTINGGSYQSIPGGEYNSISNNSSLVYNPALSFEDKFRLGDGINDASLISPSSWYSSWFSVAVLLAERYGDHKFDGDSMKTEGFLYVLSFLGSNINGFIFLTFNNIYPTKRAPSDAWFWAPNLFGGSWSWISYDSISGGPWVYNNTISDWLYFYPNSTTVYRNDTGGTFTLSGF